VVDIEAFCFDLDGTLIDSEVLYVDAVRSCLEECGCFLSRAESLSLVYGHGWTDIYQKAAHRFPEACPPIEEMESAVRRHFQRLRAERDIRIPGSIELLKALAERYAVAIVSGSPRRDVAEAISRLALNSHLVFHLGAEDYGPGKPDPRCYRLAASMFDLPPDSCLVFEDSAAGVQAAKSAGMYCVALARPEAPRQDLSLADAVFSDLGRFDLQEFRRLLTSHDQSH
jgi:HAD superfamily hydrolase (TIGR01509 family)